jgi:hypothetical protein
MPGVLAALRDDTPSKDDRRILNFQFKGYRVILGKNSFSNERIIAEHAHRECLWFHAMAARGSHVILCLYNLPEPTEDVLQYAAKLALDHSHSQARTVMVSLLRDVFKPEDAGIGIWKTSRNETVEVLE